MFQIQIRHKSFCQNDIKQNNPRGEIVYAYNIYTPTHHFMYHFRFPNLNKTTQFSVVHS